VGQGIWPVSYYVNLKLLSLAALVAEISFKATAQTYDPGLIGYVPLSFVTGSNLFNNALLADGTNSLSAVFTNTFIPKGTTVSLWNSPSQSFGPTSTFTNGSWSVDFPLLPGTGALVVAPVAFTLTCSGTVLNPDGTLFTPQTSTNPPIPPAFTGLNGTYLLGDKLPTTDIGTNIFLDILGRLPYVGEQVSTLSSTSTYLGGGNWDLLPTLDPGQAVFLKVMAPPPPLLTIIDNNNQVIISWPLSFIGWTLQTNNNLLTGGWGNYAGTVVNNAVTNPPIRGNLFFRLMYP
jgi:hypothetical protein